MKYVSLVGDSITTFYGFNPAGYRVFYDEEECGRNGLSSVYDTWWAKVNQFLHAYICVNNSYSGSKVAGDVFPSASSDERILLLHTREAEPDIILIYMGFNDFGYGVKILPRPFAGREGFFPSYCRMLRKIKHHYPKSRIICGTLMQSFVRDDPGWVFPRKWGGIAIEKYNQAIKIAAWLSGAETADLAALNIRYETLDGAHPTRAGHDTLAQAWIACLKKIGGKQSL